MIIVGNVLVDLTNLWVNMPLIEKYLKRDCIILLKVAKIHILPPIEHKRFSLDQTGHFQLFLLDFFWILRRVFAHFLDFWILKKIDRYINFLHFTLVICILEEAINEFRGNFVCLFVDINHRKCKSKFI